MEGDDEKASYYHNYHTPSWESNDAISEFLWCSERYWSKINGNVGNSNDASGEQGKHIDGVNIINLNITDNKSDCSKICHTTVLADKKNFCSFERYLKEILWDN